MNKCKPDLPEQWCMCGDERVVGVRTHEVGGIIHTVNGCAEKWAAPDPEPVPQTECCTDGTCESCAPRFAWADYRKDYEPNDTITAHKAFHAGWEAARDHYAPSEPVPHWRALVDAGVRNLTNEDPLTVVLRSLANISDPSKVTTANLARIVAVCEREVGDGWQANPDRVPRGHWGITWLLAPLSHESPDWGTVADRAAAWLRDLTTDGAA